MFFNKPSGSIFLYSSLSGSKPKPSAVATTPKPVTPAAVKEGQAVALDIQGDQVQGVGLRKKLHQLIEDHKAEGLAVNNPVKKTVEAVLDASPEKRKLITDLLAKQIEEETGSPVTITEKPELPVMHDIELTPEDLTDLSAHLYLKFLQSHKAEGKDLWRDKPDITLAKAEEDMIPRYRLKKTDEGNYVGKVPELARKQLMKEEAPYHYMLDEALVADQLTALNKMHPDDRLKFFDKTASHIQETVAPHMTLDMIKASIDRPRHIFITGLPGSGKTTTGEALAKELGLPLISVDGLNNATEGKDPEHIATVTTKHLLKELSSLTTPHIIEGVQVAGLKPEVTAGSEVIMLEPSDDTIYARLAERGLVDEDGVLQQGLDNAYIKQQVKGLKNNMTYFKNNHPDAVIKQAFNTPEELATSMSNMQYKYLSKDNKLTDAKAGSGFAENYKLMSPDEVEAHQAGVCWDQTEYARTKLEDAGYAVNTFYIEKSRQPMRPTHSFLTFTGEDGKKYWFENAFGKHKGIHGPYETNDAIISDVNDKMTQDDPNANQDPEFTVKEFKKQKAGISVQDYMGGMAELPEYKQASAITEGYHYARGGYEPSNMLNLPEDEQKKLMAWRVKQILKDDPNASEERMAAREARYMASRIQLEKLLREVAKKKLGEKTVEHPLYFRTDKVDKAWGHKMSAKGRYEIHPDLLDQATYHRGDSFDLLRKSNDDEALLKELVAKDVLTKAELDSADKRKLRMLKREYGNYTEGQLWAPYKIEGNMVVPVKQAFAAGHNTYTRTGKHNSALTANPSMEKLIKNLTFTGQSTIKQRMLQLRNKK